MDKAIFIIIMGGSQSSKLPEKGGQNSLKKLKTSSPEVNFILRLINNLTFFC
jgi:hypothetical protein